MESKAKIEYFCAYQERCHSEVSKKLYDWGLAPDQVDALLADLIQNNFLNEGRFAESYVSGKFRMKKWGRNKIRLHLKQKKVNEYSIKKALESIDDEEYLECLELLIQKKYKEAKGNKWEKRQKTYSFLVHKGYESSVVQDALDRLISL
ncbi:MAG: RecX family transcriptional regulator [Crocinitomicaceae bacterium]|nr:RecX family transcriptional regulator [Crocinitomicaceae bacterium]